MFPTAARLSTVPPIRSRPCRRLYSLPASDFNSVTTGYNGISAGPGYDELTGLGSPIANLLVPALASYGLASQVVVTSQPPASVTAGNSFGLTVAIENAQGSV